MSEISELKFNSNKKPLVSICMLTYNHENFVNEAIDSILMQQINFDVEILIHDDASTDQTQAILKTYNNEHPDLFKLLLQTENQRSKFGGGMGPRFNYPRAKGKYIALCEGDDYWTDPHKLQKQVDFLEENEAYSMCSHQTESFYNEDNVKSKIIGDFKKGLEIISTKDILRGGSIIHTSSLCFRKSAFKSQELTQFINSGDYALKLVCSLYGPIYVLQEIMSRYRLHQGSLTNTNKYHEGMGKFFNMMSIYINFNQYTNFKFQDDIEFAIKKDGDLYFIKPIISKARRETRESEHFETKQKLLNNIKGLSEIISFENTLKLLWYKIKNKISIH